MKIEWAQWRTRVFTFIACVLAGAAGAVAVQLIEAATS
jgi:hypothetical protein